MRLFVAAEVGEDARRAIDRLERPSGEGLRWTDPSTWHVTLRFLGQVDASEAAERALAAAAVAGRPATAVARPTLERLGASAIVLRVDGLDVVADAVADAFGERPGQRRRRRFDGHLTVGRLRTDGRWPVPGVGSLDADLRWEVDEIVLVRSHLGRDRVRHEVLARRRLEGA